MQISLSINFLRKQLQKAFGYCISAWGRVQSLQVYTFQNVTHFQTSGRKFAGSEFQTSEGATYTLQEFRGFHSAPNSE